MISRELWFYTSLAFLGWIVLCAATSRAADTEPRLALMRVTPHQSASGSITLQVEGTFSFANAVQLGLPLNILVSQGQLRARFDLAGNVFTTLGSGSEQAVAGLGVISIAEREMLLVLPAGFSAGTATAQVTATYDGQSISSNQLSFTL